MSTEFWRTLVTAKTRWHLYPTFRDFVAIILGILAWYAARRYQITKNIHTIPLLVKKILSAKSTEIRRRFCIWNGKACFFTWSIGIFFDFLFLQEKNVLLILFLYNLILQKQETVAQQTAVKSVSRGMLVWTTWSGKVDHVIHLLVPRDWDSRNCRCVYKESNLQF